MTSRTSQRRSVARRAFAGKRPTARGKQVPRRGKRSSNRTAIAAISVVAVLAVGIIGVGVLRKPAGAPVTSTGDAAEAIRLVTSVPASVLDGANVVSGITPPMKLRADMPAFTHEGKPEILYIGA